MNILLTIVIITSILNIVALYAHFWLINRALQIQHEQIRSEISDIFVLTDKDGLTVFNRFAQAIIEALGITLASKLKASVMGVASGAARQADAVVNAIIEDNGSPLMGGMLSAFPALGKILKKRPEAAQMIQMALAKTGGGNGHMPDSNSRAKFNI